METRSQPAKREPHTVDANPVATADASKLVLDILNWNDRVETLACLVSLKAIAYPNWDAIVVDNGSEDGSVDAIRMHLPLGGRAAVWLNTVGTISSLAKVVDIAHQLVPGRCGPRQAYWEAVAFLRAWRHGLSDPGARLIRRARIQGVRDYLTRRFGDCPSWIREAGLRGGRPSPSLPA